MASARCALRRRSLDAAAYTADRTSGCRNSKRSAATLTSPLASATASAPTSSSATAAALARVGRSPVSLAAARSSSSRAGSGSAPRRSRYIRVTRAPTVSGGSTGSEDPNDELSPASSMRASGLPPVPRWRRSSVASEERGAFCCVAPHERRARSAVETGDRVARQVGLVEQGRLVAAHGEHDRDGFGDEPTDGEQQGVGGRAVDPVRIVHEDEERDVLGVCREQRQRRTDGEPVLGRRGPEGERAFQRLPLGPRDLVEVVEGRPEELEQRRERDAGLRTSPRSAA